MTAAFLEPSRAAHVRGALPRKAATPAENPEPEEDNPMLTTRTLNSTLDRMLTLNRALDEAFNNTWSNANRVWVPAIDVVVAVKVFPPLNIWSLTQTLPAESVYDEVDPALMKIGVNVGEETGGIASDTVVVLPDVTATVASAGSDAECPPPE